MKTNKVKGIKADGWGHRSTSHHAFLKKNKRRIERRRAKMDPECAPAYRKFKGYES